jgi:hypothetical protein
MALNLGGGGLVARGSTFYGPTQTIDTDDYAGVDHEGIQALFKDVDPSDGTALRSGREVKAILVRNVTGGTLYKGAIVTWASTYIGKRVGGNCCVAMEQVAGVVDEHLSSAGVRNGDLFWLTVEGPTLALKSRVAGDGVIVAGDPLFAATAANSTGTTGATTGGKFFMTGTTFNLTADVTGGTIAQYGLNRLGRAISASTTSRTSSQELIDVGA